MGHVMKPIDQKFPAADQASEKKITDWSLDRRRFMESAALVGAMASLSGGALAQAAPSSRNMSDSRLPDGTEFIRWEQPLTFSKTYYVDNTSPNADDNGPGDKA